MVCCVVHVPVQAVLENVIFVHQEESNWPLAEGKVGGRNMSIVGFLPGAGGQDMALHTRVRCSEPGLKVMCERVACVGSSCACALACVGGGGEHAIH